MSKFSNGKIYKLTSRFTDYIFLGCTTAKLNLVLQKKKAFFKNNIDFREENKYISSFCLLIYSDCSIELIEAFECSSQKELDDELQSVMDAYKANLVKVANNHPPFGDDLECKKHPKFVYPKKYKETEKKKQQYKEKYKKNLEKKKQDPEYKAAQKRYVKEYQQKNKEKISQKNKERYQKKKLLKNE